MFTTNVDCVWQVKGFAWCVDVTFGECASLVRFVFARGMLS